MATHIRNGQLITAHGATADWAEDHGFDRYESPASPAELKGAALNAALDEAGLSKTGTADEKRARLAAAQQPAVDNPDPDELDAPDNVPTDPSQDQ